MAPYINRCPTCGCTNAHRILRQDVDKVKALCEKMLNFIADIDLDSDPVAHLLRSCIISDAESMGIAPANKGE